jgi:hypothetical protein
VRNALLLGVLLLATVSACPPGTTSYNLGDGRYLTIPRACGDVVGDCCPVTPNTTVVPKR